MPTAADLALLKRIGLDFVRIPLDPGPILAAPPAEATRLLEAVVAAVRQVLEAGLAAILNVQANAATHFWTPARLYGTADAPGLGAYRALVATLAGRLAAFDPARVALEPVNEPPQGCDGGAWTAIQADLLGAARRAAPNLLLVATGGCGSMISGLLGVDPAGLARFAPVIFTFHFYEPYLFSHQGASWMTEPVYRDLNAVPWPSAAGTLERTLAAVRGRMAVDGGRSVEAKHQAYGETERVLTVYFDAAPGRPFVDGYLDKVAGWCARHRVPPGRVLLGEFGALGSAPGAPAAPRADRLRYIADVRASAEAHGFPWAMWDLFTDMGMMDDLTHALDRGVVEALGLAMPTGAARPPG